MLINICAKTYFNTFSTEHHPFISEKFIELNKHKSEELLMLVKKDVKSSIGLVAGVKNGFLLSPFSAPFGGFHFRHEMIYISELQDFILDLQAYIEGNGYKGICITIPPDLYHQTFNSKTINSLYYNNFKIKTIDITSWVNLSVFNNNYTQKRSVEYYQQANKSGLIFKQALNCDEKKQAYELIKINRAKFERPIYMTFPDLEQINEIWDIDYFLVSNKNDDLLASAILYKAHKTIVYAVFWGDSELGRSLKAMNFCLFNLWKHYKNLGYSYIDISISTEDGIPNEGLLRFKEMHEGISSLRYTFTWTPNK
jgi:hypothetical protein